MKASAKVTVEISMEEVRRNIITDLPAKELLKACRFELRCVLDGYVNGSVHRYNGWGGWKAAFFEGLVCNNERISANPNSPYFN